MPEYLSPGVYVEEFEIGAKPIEGVSTSTAGFVGIAEKGPLNKPTLVDSMGKFVETFGDFVKGSYLAYSVSGFFENGGKRCFVVRIANDKATAAYVKIQNRKLPAEDILQISAVNEGAWGRDISVEITDASSGATFLYASALTKDADPGSDLIAPVSLKGLLIGDKVKLSDGIKSSPELTVVAFEGDQVRLSGKPDQTYAAFFTQVMAVVTAPADPPATYSAAVKSSVAFEQGDLVSFLEPGAPPVYVNLTNVSASTNQLSWQGQFSQADGTKTNKVEGAKLVEVKRVEITPLSIQTADLAPGAGVIPLANIKEDAKAKIRKGDTLTFGSGPTVETVTVQEVKGNNLNFSPTVKNLHKITEKFKALTAPQAKVFSLPLAAPVEATFDTGVPGFKKDDILVFLGGANPDEERTVTAVDGKKVTLDQKPAGDRTKVTMKYAGTKAVVVDTTDGFQAGDLAEAGSKLLAIKAVEGNRLFFTSALDGQETAFVVKEWKTTAVNGIAFGVKVKYEKGKKKLEENFKKLTMQPGSSSYLAKDEVVNRVSKLIVLSDLRTKQDGPVGILDLPKPSATPLPLSQGGEDGIDDLKPDHFVGKDKGKGERTGLVAFEAVDEINILCIPDIMVMKNPDDKEILQSKMISHCERMADRFAVLDSPRNYGVTEIQSWKKDNLDSKYAALYYPWIKVMDPIGAENGNMRLVPPSGYIAGIYARSDTERGVHKAPANEVVRGALDLEFPVTSGEQDILNPSGVNCIRALPGRGIRVWGARTVSSDSLWKYVNVRRLFLFLEESIDEGTQWVVFEPNDIALWARVKQTIVQFLTGVWRGGALAGATPDEAFFVKCDRTTMTQDDIDNGKLICVIGVAPVKPAEFVIFRIAQWTAGAKS
jgi:hypothetical protein